MPLTEDDELDVLSCGALQQTDEPGEDLLSGACAVHGAYLCCCYFDNARHLAGMIVKTHFKLTGARLLVMPGLT